MICRKLMPKLKKWLTTSYNNFLICALPFTPVLSIRSISDIRP